MYFPKFKMYLSWWLNIFSFSEVHLTTTAAFCSVQNVPTQEDHFKLFWGNNWVTEKKFSQNNHQMKLLWIWIKSVWLGGSLYIQILKGCFVHIIPGSGHLDIRLCTYLPWPPWYSLVSTRPAAFGFKKWLQYGGRWESRRRRMRRRRRKRMR